jgi:hypothetical protein
MCYLIVYFSNAYTQVRALAQKRNNAVLAESAQNLGRWYRYYVGARRKILEQLAPYVSNPEELGPKKRFSAFDEYIIRERWYLQDTPLEELRSANNQTFFRLNPFDEKNANLFGMWTFRRHATPSTLTYLQAFPEEEAPAFELTPPDDDHTWVDGTIRHFDMEEFFKKHADEYIRSVTKGKRKGKKATKGRKRKAKAKAKEEEEEEEEKEIDLSDEEVGDFVDDTLNDVIPPSIAANIDDNVNTNTAVNESSKDVDIHDVNAQDETERDENDGDDSREEERGMTIDDENLQVDEEVGQGKNGGDMAAKTTASKIFSN